MPLAPPVPMLDTHTGEVCPNHAARLRSHKAPTVDVAIPARAHMARWLEADHDVLTLNRIDYSDAHPRVTGWATRPITGRQLAEFYEHGVVDLGAGVRVDGRP